MGPGPSSALNPPRCAQRSWGWASGRRPRPGPGSRSAGRGRAAPVAALRSRRRRSPARRPWRGPARALPLVIGPRWKGAEVSQPAGTRPGRRGGAGARERAPLAHAASRSGPARGRARGIQGVRRGFHRGAAHRRHLALQAARSRGRARDGGVRWQLRVRRGDCGCARRRQPRQPPPRADLRSTHVRLHARRLTRTWAAPPRKRGEPRAPPRPPSPRGSPPR